MRTLLAITKALADQNRVRILCALEQGELCVCQIIEMLCLAPSTTSKHLSILAGAGLVEVRKDGRWVYYRLSGEAPEAAKRVVDWLIQRASKKKPISDDRKKLKKILSQSPEELCQRQANEKKCCSSAPETRAAVRSQKVTQERSKVNSSKRIAPESSPMGKTPRR